MNFKRGSFAEARSCSGSAVCSFCSLLRRYPTKSNTSWSLFSESLASSSINRSCTVLLAMFICISFTVLSGLSSCGYLGMVYPTLTSLFLFPVSHCFPLELFTGGYCSLPFQLLQQRFGLFEVCGVKAFSEPAVDLG